MRAGFPNGRLFLNLSMMQTTSRAVNFGRSTVAALTVNDGVSL